jgi:hypothetical protein
MAERIVFMGKVEGYVKALEKSTSAKRGEAEGCLEGLSFICSGGDQAGLEWGNKRS